LALISLLAVAACSTLADLDVAYDGNDAGDGDGGDGGRRVRDSSAEAEPTPDQPTLAPSAQVPCNDSTDPDGGCDIAQGLGCCLKPGASMCIFQWEATALCAGGTFVGCREDDPDSPCCWRTVNGVRQAVHAAFCDGGAHACVVNPDSGGSRCEQGTCTQSVCNVGAAGTFTIGACGATEPCP
jgi:hypothetical protein